MFEQTDAQITKEKEIDENIKEILMKYKDEK
jgi:hypothetical protein